MLLFVIIKKVDVCSFSFSLCFPCRRRHIGLLGFQPELTTINHMRFKEIRALISPPPLPLHSHDTNQLFQLLRERDSYCQVFVCVHFCEQQPCVTERCGCYMQFCVCIGPSLTTVICTLPPQNRFSSKMAIRSLWKLMSMVSAI